MLASIEKKLTDFWPGKQGSATAQLGDARLRARKEERTWLRELTAGAPETFL